MQYLSNLKASIGIRERKGGREGGKEGGGRERKKERGREGGREGGRKKEREGGREGGGRERKKEGGREGGREGESRPLLVVYLLLFFPSSPLNHHSHPKHADKNRINNTAT